MHTSVPDVTSEVLSSWMKKLKDATEITNLINIWLWLISIVLDKIDLRAR